MLPIHKVSKKMQYRSHHYKWYHLVSFSSIRTYNACHNKIRKRKEYVYIWNIYSHLLILFWVFCVWKTSLGQMSPPHAVRQLIFYLLSFFICVWFLCIARRSVFLLFEIFFYLKRHFILFLTLEKIELVYLSCGCFSGLFASCVKNIFLMHLPLTLT